MKIKFPLKQLHICIGDLFRFSSERATGIYVLYPLFNDYFDISQMPSYQFQSNKIQHYRPILKKDDFFKTRSTPNNFPKILL